jgi:hypothetical protein
VKSTLNRKWDAFLTKGWGYGFLVGYLVTTCLWSILILVGLIGTSLPILFPAGGLLIALFILAWLYITLEEPPISAKPYRKYRG